MFAIHFNGHWGSVAEWLGCRTVDRGVLGSDPGRVASEPWHFRLCNLSWTPNSEIKRLLC